ncbi:MAG: arginine deiminase, partial [Nocardioidaceae bacterium]
MTQTSGADSEVGRLRTVLLHRPGAELQRLTPRNNDSLLFDGIPWVSRAQEEHDAFASALRERDVEVLYLMDLLTESIDASASAREQAIRHATASLRLGDTLRGHLQTWMHKLDTTGLAGAITAGVRNDEVRGGFGLVTSLLDPHDFVIDPLPNLLFTRDSSVWLRDRVAVTSLAMPARARETQLTELIYTFHPRFEGTARVHGWEREHVEGGDVLLLAPGVIAVGAGERTTPAGVEWFARQVFAEGIAHTVLAVPIAQERATMHLDTVCTMVDVDAMVMYPKVADSLRAHAITCVEPHEDPARLQLSVAQGEPFLVAAAKAMGIDTLRQIYTGLDPVTAEREQWDDGNNTLAIAPRVAVAYERNVET